ncbi:MAG TPA: alpha/beta hydrolase, partial [Actinomycetota bacterium]|nr:alpha/beta hydrolase [Actinomycetota bacterium]
MPLARRLASRDRVYVPDLPGFGRSAKVRRALTLPELADLLDEWMSSCSLGAAVMVGNSFGCEVVAELALRHPERLEAAVFLGPTIDRRHRNVWSQAWRFVATAVREPLGLARPLLADYLQAGVKRPLQTLRYALRDPLEAKLPRIAAPILVLRGENDAIVPQRWAEEVASLLPRGELRVVPGGAHVLNYDSAASVAAIVEAWNPAAEGG